MRNIDVVLSILKAIFNSKLMSNKVLARVQVFVHEITNNVLSALNDVSKTIHRDCNVYYLFNVVFSTHFLCHFYTK